MRRKSGDYRRMEENTMAILDTSGFERAIHYTFDDRIAFLEAIRFASILPEEGTVPTNKMYEAIFQILKDENSLELVMESYQLLNELEKRFPQVYVSKQEKLGSPSASAVPELVMVEEAWSPFNFRLDNTSSGEEFRGNSGGSIDSSGFQLLLRELAKETDEENVEAFETKSLRNMLLLQYLIKVLEGDFSSRNCIYQDSRNWTVLRASMLNMLLGSRAIYKGLVKDCLYIMCRTSHLNDKFSEDMGLSEKSSMNVSRNCDTALAIALPEVKECTCVALRRLLLLMMEFDELKKEADAQGLTTRADGVRTPVAEIILDELTYNTDILPLFFLIFAEPKWNLEIILQYFRKYIAKPSVRTRKSSGSTDHTTFEGILKSFSDSKTAKSIVKKINIEVVQLLLAHGFQASLSLSSQHSEKGISNSMEDVRNSSLLEVCKDTISAFSCLKSANEHKEILPLGKEALFTAATILASKS